MADGDLGQLYDPSNSRFGDNLINFGLATMAAGSHPGASTMGSLAQGGLSAIEMQQKAAAANAALQQSQAQTQGLQNANMLSKLQNQLQAAKNPLMIKALQEEMGNPSSTSQNNNSPSESQGMAGNSWNATPATQDLSPNKQSTYSAGNSGSLLPTTKEAIVPHIITNYEGVDNQVKKDSNGADVKFGINQAANPDVDVKNLTMMGAKNIIGNKYYDAIDADKLPPELRLAAVDSAVNMGVPATKDMLAQSGGDVAKFMALRGQKYSALSQNADPASVASWQKRYNSQLQMIAQAKGDNPNNPEATQWINSWGQKPQEQQQTGYTDPTTPQEKQQVANLTQQIKRNKLIGMDTTGLQDQLNTMTKGIQERITSQLNAANTLEKVKAEGGQTQQNKLFDSGLEYQKGINDAAGNAVQLNRELAKIKDYATMASTGKLGTLNENASALKLALDPNKTWLASDADEKTAAALEGINKVNAQMAGQAIREWNNRGGNRIEFETYLKNNPNALTTPVGLKNLTNFMQKTQEQIIGKQAAFHNWKQGLDENGNKISEPKDVKSYSDFDNYWNQKQYKDTQNTIAPLADDLSKKPSNSSNMHPTQAIPMEKRVKGQKYPTPQGEMTWTGTGWRK